MTNKYLEKIALADKAMARVGKLGNKFMHLAKTRPLTAAGMVLGSVDGMNKTTHKKNESYVVTALRGARNTLTGGATGAAVGAIADHVLS